MSIKSVTDVKQLEINGKVVQYIEFGTGEKTLVMVHGFPGRPQDFRWLNEHLQEQFRVIQIALPGMGYTPLEACAETSLEKRAQFVISFLDHLKIEKCWLLGHSIGGALSIVIASKEPKRIDRLLLLASFGLRPHKAYRQLPPKFVFTMSQLPVLCWLIMPIMRKGFTARGFAKGITDESIVHTLRCLYAIDFTAIRSYISNLRCPTMNIWAQNDPLIEAAVQVELSSQLPDGPRISFERGGHNPQRSHAEDISEKIIAWQ